MTFYLGCAVWSYKGWVGNFYPPKTPSKDFLFLYSRRFTTVEGNTTFYAVPNAETVQRWCSETPKGFKFVPKLPKAITHNGQLTPFLSEAVTFFERMQGLGEHLVPIFAQLPPSYSPEYLEDLATFLQALSGYQVPLALEVRHRNWYKQPYINQLQALLESLSIARVLLDSRPVYNAPDGPQIASERRKPKLPLQPHVTAPFSLIRFISHPQATYNQSYLQEWVKQVDEWLNQGIDIYFFVHCPIEEHSPFTARSFQQLLEDNGVNISPLPWNQLPESSGQMNLF